MNNKLQSLINNYLKLEEYYAAHPNSNKEVILRRAMDAIVCYTIQLANQGRLYITNTKQELVAVRIKKNENKKR